MRYRGSGRSPPALFCRSPGRRSIPRDKLLLQHWQMLSMMGSILPAAGRQQGKAHPSRRQGSMMLSSALLADLSQAPWLGLQFPLEGERHHQSIIDHSNLWSSTWQVLLVLVFPYKETPTINTRSAAVEIKVASLD